jgi:hypothetical protein
MYIVVIKGIFFKTFNVTLELKSTLVYQQPALYSRLLCLVM